MKEEYKDCNTIQHYINKGIDATVFDEILADKPREKKLSKSDLNTLRAEGIEELYNRDETTEWFENPGGISQNISSKLPKFLLIEDKSKDDELSGSSGALMVTLKQLFDDVREESDNFKQAQHYLNQLAQELDPQDETSDFAGLLRDLNHVVGDVFPDTSFIAQANLSNPDEVIKPKFDVQLGSNIHTSIDNQGAGVVRSAIFAMLRYRNMRENKKKQQGEYVRPLLIAFEEPEIYLHPQAAKQMKETIYNLSMEENNQIICTTHSPYMINLSKDTNQTLNTFNLESKKIQFEERNVQIEQVVINPFNISSAFQSLVEEDKSYIKMLLKVDDSVAKIFFVQKVLIVEGDTEEWENSMVDVSSAETMEEVLQLVEPILEEKVANTDGRLRAIRIQLHGDTPVHTALQKEKDELVNNLRSLAIDISEGEIWIEKVKWHTTSRFTVEELRDEHSPVAAIFQYIDTLKQDEAEIEEITSLFSSLTKNLPKEVFGEEEGLPLENRTLIKNHVDKAQDFMLSHLTKKEGGPI